MFTLLQEDILYKKVITTTGGSYVDGVWITGTQEISYEEIEGIVEPYLKSEQSVVLPEGVSNTDALILFSPDELKTHTSMTTGSNLADVIFVVDPRAYFSVATTVSTTNELGVSVEEVTVEQLIVAGYEDQIADKYVVWDKMVWLANKGFTLIDDHYEYILIREDRI